MNVSQRREHRGDTTHRIQVDPAGGVRAGALDLSELIAAIGALAVAPAAASGLCALGRERSSSESRSATAVPGPSDLGAARRADAASPDATTALDASDSPGSSADSTAIPAAENAASASSSPLSARELDDVLESLAQLRSAISALEARTLASRALRTEEEDAADGVPASRRGRRTPMEAAMACRDDLSRVRRRLRASQRLVHDLPRLFSALAGGALREEAALAIGRSAGPLTPEQRGLIDEHLHAKHPYMEGASSGEWAREVDRLAHQLDPAGRRGRAIRAARERTVTVSRAPHGMAHLHAHLPAVEGMAIRKALSLHAEKLRSDGDRRGHGPIMADRLTDLLLGRDEAWDPITLDLGVIITERSLLEPDNGEPAILEGYGAVPPAQLPEWLREHPDAMMRRLFTHPTSGELIALESRARTVPEGLARLVAWRDQRCRAPFCDAPIRQFDHISSWAEGGATSLENLQALCQHCNLVKESAVHVAATRIDGRHVVHWRSRSRRTVHCTAPALVDAPAQHSVPNGTAGTLNCSRAGPLSLDSPGPSQSDTARADTSRADTTRADTVPDDIDLYWSRPSHAAPSASRHRMSPHDDAQLPLPLDLHVEQSAHAPGPPAHAPRGRPPRAPHRGRRRRTGRERSADEVEEPG